MNECTMAQSSRTSCNVEATGQNAQSAFCASRAEKPVQQGVCGTTCTPPTGLLYWQSGCARPFTGCHSIGAWIAFIPTCALFVSAICK